jgi:hypothetical protein
LLIIHCGYGRNFFLWGERSFSAKSFRGRRKFTEDGVTDHLFGAGADQVAAALSELGFDYPDAARAETLRMRLPTAAGKYPVPSTATLGELPKAGDAADVVTREWLVETLPLRVTDMPSLTAALASRGEITEDGRFLAHGMMAAIDLCYVMECFSFALSLMERGRFLPDIKASPDGARYEPMWSPVFIGDDAVRYRLLEAAAPEVIRAREGSGADGGDFSPRDVFSDFIDSVIRRAWTKKGESGGETSSGRIARAIMKKTLGADAPAGDVSETRERKRRGKLVNALNPHSLWIRSLGWLGETDGLSQSLASIYHEVRDWRDRYEWFEHAPFSLVIRLSGGDAGWRLDYSARVSWEPNAIPAGDVWRTGGETGDYMRRYMLLMLGRIGAFYPVVRDSLACAAPDGRAVSRDEAEDFLRGRAPALAEMGVEIGYPDWWIGGSRDALTIVGTPGREPSSLRWEPAWRGVVLTGEERSEIMSGRLLVRIGGGWAFIEPEHLDEITGRVISLPERMSDADAVRLAVRDQHISGFIGLPALEALYEAIRKGTPPEILDAPGAMSGNLRPYQRRGYSWLVFLSGLGVGACLADDMGLGKTVQTLALIQRHRDIGRERPVLLICPTSVMENWRMEILRFFPSMSFYTHHGHERLRGTRFAAEANRCAVVISSYSLLHRDVDLWKGVEWSGVVLDEAQNIKNPDTRQAKSARGIKSDWRVALTGTPVENHAGDLWSIMDFLMPGMLGSKRRFADKYVKPMSKSPDPRVADELRRRIAPLVMRRLKTDPDIAPDLPEKLMTNEYCLLKKEQAKLYASAAGELTKDIGRVSGIRRRGVVLAGLTRMKQICDHPSLVLDDGDFGCDRSSKLERLLSMAEEMFEAGDRALIFTQYVEMGGILKHQLQERFGREAYFLHGGVPKDRRDKMVRDFQEGTGPRFFVLSLRAGGVGLNLTGANHVVMFDRWWNPAVETQAIDRAYRIGQTRNVHVHIFCCRGTLEERIAEMISSKRRVADSLVWESDEWVTELSDSDLKYLVSLSQTAVE